MKNTLKKYKTKEFLFLRLTILSDFTFKLLKERNARKRNSYVF
jgi:hypothetical protein